MQLFLTATVLVALIGNHLVFGSKIKFPSFQNTDTSNLAFNFRNSPPDASTQGKNPGGQEVIPPQSSQTIPSQTPLTVQNQTSQSIPSQSPQKILSESSQFSPSESSQKIPSQSPSPSNPPQILQTVPSQSPQITQSESSQTIPNQGSQNIPNQGYQNIPNQGSQTIPNQVSQNIPNQGTQNIPNQGSQNIPNQGSQNVPNQGSQNIPNQGSQNVPNQGSQNIPNQGSQNIPNQGSQNSPNQGSQNVPNQGSQNIPTQGSQNIPNQGSQNIPNQGSQNIPNQGLPSIPPQGSQKTPQGVPSQSTPAGSPEVIPEMQQSRPPVSGQNLPTPKPVSSVTGQQAPVPNDGEEVQLQDVPYQLGLEIEGIHLCGASVIGDHWALTSAYCTHSPPSSKKAIRLRSKTTVHRAIHVTTYPSTRSSNAAPHDIAVVLVTPPFAADTALSLPKKRPVAGTQAVLTGWGQPECTEPGSCLRRQSILVVDQGVCTSVYREVGMEVREGMLCAGNLSPGKGVCIGDPGGPLVVGNEVVGIVSWGKDCSGEFPGVYTDVAQYREWIEGVIGNDEA